jgi:uncharacterized protein YdcH (DUF465 family)|tara:strand:+ start:4240 stop:4419 length:180 start_codon:yes stop_codon:yes gene_type:complete
MSDYAKRLEILKETHKFLNKQVDKLEKTGSFKDEELMEMKKKRLKMKDEIERIERGNAI